ncbi:hypothetical protein [Glaesserella sp. 15-184]|uniref:DUF3261 domain-containing protein n=2 Tax=Glaesserella australis TaxID=2094024 RepID=A0A328BX15_9PAST|nr:hypothetical protein [Glaesserella sp. 15-184]AUI66530.1 hypothetical protein CJD39_08045 [Glaesserella sp. 15-184]RAL18703.1 hypothetical protein C5N92_06065 [Glaesserella australis]
MVYALGACSSAPSVQQLPIQSTENLLFKVEQQSPKSEASLLAIQFTPHQWRWVQTDPLGAPIARLILEKNGWKNDGFVMPNQQAQHLYSALATALNPTQPLFDFSGIEQTTSGQIYQINGKEVWRILQQKNQFQITLADGSRWHIELLE